MTASLVNLVDQLVKQNHQFLLCHKTVCQFSNTSQMQEKHPTCVDQDSVQATVCNSLSRASFSGKRVLELLIQSSEQSPTIPAKLLEILAEEAFRRRGVRNGYCHQVAAPRPVVSCRRRSRLRQVVGHLLVLRDVSIRSGTALRTLATRKLYQQTLEHFLPFVAKHSLPNAVCPFWRTRRRLRLSQFTATLNTCLEYSITGGNTLMAAFMHRYHPYSRHGGGEQPRFHQCLRELDIAHSWSNAKRFFPTRVVINRS